MDNKREFGLRQVLERVEASVVSRTDAEAVCRKILPFTAARRLAFRRESAEEDTRQHLSTCRGCNALIDNWEDASHPSRSWLLVYALDASSHTNAAAIQRHLDRCETCAILLAEGPIAYLASTIARGRRALDGAIEALEAFPSGSVTLPAYSYHFAGPDNTFTPFETLVENKWFRLSLKQEQDRLIISLLIDQPTSPYRAVDVEILSGAYRLRERVPLEKVGRIWTGGGMFKGFDRLLAPNAELRFEATPLIDLDMETSA